MKSLSKLLLCLFIIFSYSVPSYTDDRMQKVDKISKNLRCLICQGQSVYDSQSDFALSLKELINNKLDSGSSEEDIYKYLQSRYGDWILYEPEFDKNTILLWGIPLILFIFGGLLIFRKVIIKLNKNNV